MSRSSYKCFDFSDLRAQQAAAKEGVGNPYMRVWDNREAVDRSRKRAHAKNGAENRRRKARRRGGVVISELADRILGRSKGTGKVKGR